MNEQIRKLFECASFDEFMEKAGFWLRRSDKTDDEIRDWTLCAYESELTHRDDFLPIVILLQLCKNGGISRRMKDRYLDAAAKTLAENDSYDPVRYLEEHAGELNDNGKEVALLFESRYIKYRLQSMKTSKEAADEQAEETSLSGEEKDDKESGFFAFVNKSFLLGLAAGVLLTLLLCIGYVSASGKDKAGSEPAQTEQQSAAVSQVLLTEASTEEMTEEETQTEEETIEESKTSESKKKDKEKKDEETKEPAKATVYCLDPRVLVRTGPSQKYSVVASVNGNETLRLYVGDVVADDSGDDTYTWREVYLDGYTDGKNDNITIKSGKKVSEGTMYYIADKFIRVLKDTDSE